MARPRSWKKTLLTIGAIFVSLLWTLGLYDLCGFTYNVLSSMIIPLVVVLAVADDVHILQHYGQERRHRSHEQAFVGTVQHLMAPLFGASATTALGMLSLATSQVVAVREFGMGSAIGVMVDFAISLVLVPTLLGLVKDDTAAAPQETWSFSQMAASPIPCPGDPFASERQAAASSPVRLPETPGRYRCPPADCRESWRTYTARGAR